MKAILCLPVLAAALFAAHIEQGPGDACDVAIYTQFAQPAGTLVLEDMKSEITGIFHPLGLRLDWRSLSEANGRQQAVSQILVVRFRGLCEVNVAAPQGSRRGPLGWTHVSDGQILPFTDVDCDRIRDILAEPLAAAVPGERARLLGRAMGRILAHELYHFLGNTSKHGTSGISKSAFNVSDLACPRLELDSAGMELVRRHLYTSITIHSPHPAL